MNRPLVLLCTTLTVWFNSSLSLAAVSSYKFKPSAAPSFWYSGGDQFTVNIGAQLSGQISIYTDENTGGANLRFDDTTIHSAFGSIYPSEFTPEPLPDNWYAEFYEGRLITELDAFDSLIPGKIISPAEIKFGPSNSEGPNRYLQHFKFTVGANSYRLSGGSFYGDDCPNYYVEGQLIPVPEPSAVCILFVATVCVYWSFACFRLRGATTV